MLRFSLSFLLLSSGLFCSAMAQEQDSKKYFRIGPGDIKALSPEKVVQDYHSNLFPNEKITIEYQGAPESLKILREGVVVPISDQVFKELDGNLRWFVLEDFQIYLGSEEPPIRCLQLSFDVTENEIVSGGGIEMCEGRPVRIRLHGFKHEGVDNLIYDSSISDEYILDGIWEQVPE